MGESHELGGFFVEASDCQALQGILQFLVRHQPGQTVTTEKKKVANSLH